MRHLWRTNSRPLISNSSNISDSLSAPTSELRLMLMICWPEDECEGVGSGRGRLPTGEGEGSVPAPRGNDQAQKAGLSRPPRGAAGRAQAYGRCRAGLVPERRPAVADGCRRDKGCHGMPWDAGPRGRRAECVQQAAAWESGRPATSASASREIVCVSPMTHASTTSDAKQAAREL